MTKEEKERIRQELIKQYREYQQKCLDYLFFGDYAHLAKPIQPTPKAQNNNIKH